MSRLRSRLLTPLAILSVLVLSVTAVSVATAQLPPAPADDVTISAAAPVQANGNLWNFPSSGNYKTVGTAVSKVKVYFKDVRISDGYSVTTPGFVTATLTPDANPPAGYASSGSWAAEWSWTKEDGHRYYSEGRLHKLNAQGQPKATPSDVSGWDDH